MAILFFCFLLGCVAGLRALTAPVVVCWGAHLGWLHFVGTRFAFIGHTTTLIILTLLALFELVNDKLPNTPARTAAPGLIARVVTGAFCGCALALSAGGNPIVAAVSGVLGALVGTFAGYNVRHALVVRAHLPDLAVALAEDVIAITGGLLIVSHL
jgi:uncharacterized membrane protein